MEGVPEGQSDPERRNAVQLARQCLEQGRCDAHRAQIEQDDTSARLRDRVDVHWCDMVPTHQRESLNRTSGTDGRSGGRGTSEGN